jgi:VCBS repeat-containing protein
MKPLIKGFLLAAALGHWASTATAHFIAGTVLCTDVTPSTILQGVTVTAQGTQTTFVGTTDAFGRFFIQLPVFTDTYIVTITPPAGSTVTSPVGGQYSASIFANGIGGPDRFEGADFGLIGCGTPPHPPVAANDTYTVNEDTLLNVSAPGVLANDTDPDQHPLQTLLVNQPAHGTLSLNANGSFSYRPATNYHGADSFSYKATDGTAASDTATVSVTVIERSPLMIVDAIHLNRQSGLFEQTVRVSNPTASGYEGVRVLIRNLATGVQVYNASGNTNGVPYVQSLVPVAPGGSIDFVIEYYVPNRVAPNPVLSAEAAAPTPPPNPAGDAQRILRQFKVSDGGMLLEFDSVSNRTYYVQYSSNFADWKTALPAIKGTGEHAQWIDNGPPKTEIPPSQSPIRFYRVLMVP